MSSYRSGNTKSYSTKTPNNVEQFEGNSFDELYLEDSEREDSIHPQGFMLLLRGTLRPIAIFLLSVAIVGSGLLIGYQYVNQNYILPPDPISEEFIEVTIKKGTSLSGISQLLDDAGLIQNRQVFKFYADFSDMGSKLKAGTYQLKKSMTMDDILLVLSKGDGRSEFTRFTSIEGTTVENIAGNLSENKKIGDKTAFLELCKSGSAFFDYSFISDIDPAKLEEGKTSREYLLEGYLFPDTYEIYTNASEETVIRKMLDRFSRIFNTVYISRAEELNMSIDEVVILASIIEKEGRPQDFKKISAVFHNRMNSDTPLQSDATIEYVLKKRRLSLTKDDLATDSPYNTHLYKGLPTGPISNPGQSAIEAALYPDEDYLSQKYMFFCAGDPEKGEVVFAKTLKEHEANVEKYRPLWEAYDAKNAR